MNSLLAQFDVTEAKRKMSEVLDISIVLVSGSFINTDRPPGDGPWSNDVLQHHDKFIESVRFRRKRGGKGFWVRRKETCSLLNLHY